MSFFLVHNFQDFGRVHVGNFFNTCSNVSSIFYYWRLWNTTICQNKVKISFIVRTRNKIFKYYFSLKCNLTIITTLIPNTHEEIPPIIVCHYSSVHEAMIVSTAHGSYHVYYLTKYLLLLSKIIPALMLDYIYSSKCAFTRTNNVNTFHVKLHTVSHIQYYC